MKTITKPVPHHLIYHDHSIAEVHFIPHPPKWVHATLHYMHGLHPLVHTQAIVHRIYMSHAGHWISDYAFIVALAVTGLLSYALYLLLSGTQIIDYTRGVWTLFG